MLAYVLVKARVGDAMGVRDRLRGQPGIEAADVITGPYDLVVRVRASSLNDIAKIVLNTLQGTPGLETTVTCPVVD